MDEVLDLDAPGSVAHESVMDKLIAARQEREKLERVEAKSVPGASVMTPKEQLLNPEEAKRHPANKGMHLRWLNITLPEKVQSRLMEGYERVPSGEGGKELGKEYALFRLPEAKADKKRKAIKEKGELWLQAHKKDMERQAEQIAKILQEKYGFSPNESKILINE